MWISARNSSSLLSIRRLLLRDYNLVEVRPSEVSEAGLGVFLKRPIDKGQAVCLYAGIYTPGLPRYVSDFDGSINLATTCPPSGGDMDTKEYIFNANVTGGYFDGEALLGMDGRRLDENPSACGQLVNHAAGEDANVEAMSFRWQEVTEGTSSEDDDCYALPNEMRADGSPWYLDGLTGNVERFRSISDSTLCGTVFLTLRDLPRGSELLLDYRLRGPPYPSWAASWYETPTSSRNQYLF